MSPIGNLFGSTAAPLQVFTTEPPDDDASVDVVVDVDDVVVVVSDDDELDEEPHAVNDTAEAIAIDASRLRRACLR